MEIELKLLIDPDDVASFRRHPLLARHAIAKPRGQRLASTYFDTPDFLFSKGGATLRVRRVARRWVQTLKAGGQVAAGLHQRHEWESRTRGPLPELAGLREVVGPETEWTSVLSDATILEPLVPIFSTTVRRTIWRLRLAPETEVELALDQGAVECAANRTPISEIELELKSGDAAALFEFALELQASLPLRVSNISKAERGFALLAPAPPAVVKAAPLRLSAQSSVADGLQTIAGNCLVQIQGNEMGVVQSDELENVHQMRVGVRRLRCALRIFDEVAPVPEALDTEVKWLGGELGGARDWEVLAGITLPEIEKACPTETGLVPLRIAAQDLARAKRKQAAAAVSSERYSRLLLALGHWMHTARARESAPPAEQAALASPLAPAEQAALALPLAEFSARTLELWHAKLEKRGKKLRHATPESRHRVRIAGRRVRYAAEFFASLYPPRRMRRYLKNLVALQDELGLLNDAAVAAGLLRHLVQADDRLAESAGFVNGYLASNAKRAISMLDRRWKRVEQIEYPQLNQG